MLNKKDAYEFARNLLSAEFDEFDNNPNLYCLSMGWSKRGIELAEEKRRKIAFSSTDIENLSSIIQSIDSDDYIEIAERDSVSDFLNNCIARYILE
jgi:hypothetical protein